MSKSIKSDKMENSNYLVKQTIDNIVDIASEIIKYYLLKSKLYILLENRSKQIMLFSVVKLKIVHKFSINSSNNKNNNGDEFNEIVKLLESFGSEACRSWFTIDIKLGSLRLSFDKDVYSWKGDLNFDYLEYIKTMTKGFTVDKSKELDENKIFNYQFKEKNNNTNTIAGGVRALVIDKKKTPGYYIVNNIFSNYFLNEKKDEEESDEDLVMFVEDYFANTKKYLALLKQNKNSITKPKDKKLHSNNPNNSETELLYDYDTLSIYALKGNRVYPIFFKSKSGIAYLNYGRNAFPVFEYKHFPSYIREALLDPNSSSFKNSKSKNKFDVILNNKYGDFVKSSGDESTEQDEIEAVHDVLVGRLKEWIIDKYINKEHFLKRVNKEINDFSDSNLVSKYM